VYASFSGPRERILWGNSGREEFPACRLENANLNQDRGRGNARLWTACSGGKERGCIWFDEPLGRCDNPGACSSRCGTAWMSWAPDVAEALDRLIYTIALAFKLANGGDSQHTYKIESWCCLPRCVGFTKSRWGWGCSVQMAGRGCPCKKKRNGRGDGGAPLGFRMPSMPDPQWIESRPASD
jgi:hypothetical protein